MGAASPLTPPSLFSGFVSIAAVKAREGAVPLALAASKAARARLPPVLRALALIYALLSILGAASLAALLAVAPPPAETSLPLWLDLSLDRPTGTVDLRPRGQTGAPAAPSGVECLIGGGIGGNESGESGWERYGYGDAAGCPSSMGDTPWRASSTGGRDVRAVAAGQLFDVDVELWLPSPRPSSMGPDDVFQLSATLLGAPLTEAGGHDASLSRPRPLARASRPVLAPRRSLLARMARRAVWAPLAVPLGVADALGLPWLLPGADAADLVRTRLFDGVIEGARIATTGVEVVLSPRGGAPGAHGAPPGSVPVTPRGRVVVTRRLGVAGAILAALRPPPALAALGFVWAWGGLALAAAFRVLAGALEGRGGGGGGGGGAAPAGTGAATTTLAAGGGGGRRSSGASGAPVARATPTRTDVDAVPVDVLSLAGEDEGTGGGGGGDGGRSVRRRKGKKGRR